MNITGIPDCFKPHPRFPDKCLNRGWCYEVFGDKLGCDQNPLNNTNTRVEIKISTHRKLEIV